MSRRVKEFIEIKDHTSLDALIEKLVEIRDTLPEAADAEVKLKGCDVFGRILSISFFRPQTQQEADCDARYAEAYQQSREAALSLLQNELGVASNVPASRSRRLRMVA
jgi:hypothetical protein